MTSVAESNSEPAQIAPAPRKSWEQWAREKQTPRMERRCTAIMHRWPIGREMTEQDFDAAVHAAANVAIR